MVALKPILLAGLVHLHLHALRGLAWASSSPTPQQIVRDLQARLSPGSEIVLTSDPGYARDFTQRFAIATPPAYVVGVKPVAVSDVQAVVRYSASKNVPFLATGGGHGYTFSLGRLESGIELDMSNFHSIDIDPAANTLTVGGAVQIGNVTAALLAAGRELPVGQCATVGLTGLTMGGGVGPYGGIHGAASDSLLSAEFVTGTGDILNVSATRHADLFYGVKGAGFNYGVATRLTYRVYPLTNNGDVMVVNTQFPGPLNGSVWELASRFVGRQPKELTLDFSLRWNASSGGMVAWCSFYYVGPQAEGLRLIQPFLDLGPLNVEIHAARYDSISSVALYSAESVGTIRGISFVPYSVNLYAIDPPSLISLFNYMNATMTGRPDLQTATLAWAQFSTYGFQLFPVESSAFPYRDVAVFFQYDGFGFNASQIPALDKFGKNVRSLMRPGSGRTDLEVYVHFGHGDEGPAAWYSAAKLPRLNALKAVYDPKNLFSYYNPVQRGRYGH
ncbi:hypothetical protein B0T26DRAFT_865985 [Lasiosphaeria miniovina]|uniref:FAD-binding PCMH-type domain-containing protein n=1 Tax=Lasiosphaeria miniovina TaxID=1954250 RepID=A0AA40DG96_9PEZI|nr:uncharacterized protein B0T26DRAFT_865985 [Lasiosphaeria miniovina]KAK0701960.1 hypothetical protein B0T26DRAFT_865985 [Lasiosphaeria miniovina]